MISENYCKAKTKKGKPCRAAATDGGLCFFHANPDKAAELGRIGGRRNHRFAMESLPLPNLDTATAVRDLAARLIAEVYAGKIHPRTAAALGPLLNLQLRVIETTTIEQKLAELERLSGEADSKGDRVDDLKIGKGSEAYGFPVVPDSSK